MKIFTIRADVSNFDYLHGDGDKVDFLSEHVFKGQSLISKWPQDYTVYWEYPKDPKPDIIPLLHLLVLPQSTLKILGPILNDICEYLPVKLENETLYLLNFLNTFDCIDKSKMKFRVHHKNPALKYLYDDTTMFFDKSNLPRQSIFIIPYNNSIQTYVTEGWLPKEKEFKFLVESNKLTGLEFQEVWSDRE